MAKTQRQRKQYGGFQIGSRVITQWGGLGTVINSYIKGVGAFANTVYTVQLDSGYQQDFIVQELRSVSSASPPGSSFGAPTSAALPPDSSFGAPTSAALPPDSSFGAPTSAALPPGSSFGAPAAPSTGYGYGSGAAAAAGAPSAGYGFSSSGFGAAATGAPSPFGAPAPGSFFNKVLKNKAAKAAASGAAAGAAAGAGDDIVRYVISSHGRPRRVQYNPPPNVELAFFTHHGVAMSCPNVLQTAACSGSQDYKIVETITNRSHSTADYLLSKDMDQSWKSGAVDCNTREVIFNLEGYRAGSEVPLSQVIDAISAHHQENYGYSKRARVYCLFCRGGTSSEHINTSGPRRYRKTRKARKSRKSRR